MFYTDLAKHKHYRAASAVAYISSLKSSFEMDEIPIDDIVFEKLVTCQEGQNSIIVYQDIISSSSCDFDSNHKHIKSDTSAQKICKNQVEYLAGKDGAKTS